MLARACPISFIFDAVPDSAESIPFLCAPHPGPHPVAGQLAYIKGSVLPRPSILGSRSRLFSVFASVHGRIQGQLLLDFQLVAPAASLCGRLSHGLFHDPYGQGKEKALYAFLAGALCVAAYGFFQYADAHDMAKDLTAQSWVDPERFPLLRRRMYSTLENPNLLGAYLLMIISALSSFFLYEKKGRRKYIFGIVLLVLLTCLALTYSRGAWVAAGGIVAGLAIFHDKRFGLLFLLVPIGLLFYHGQIAERFLSLFRGDDTSVDLRFALWESTRAMIEEHPLLGIGWGSYFLAYPDYNFFIQNDNVLIFHAHNMYLNMLAEVGIPGGLAFLAAFFAQGIIAYRIFKGGETAFDRAMGLGGMLAVILIAIISFGDHVLFSRSVSFCFWSLAGLWASCISHANEK